MNVDEAPHVDEPAIREPTGREFIGDAGKGNGE